MRTLAIALAKINIEDKIKSAPDENYQIGVLIGSFVPFIVLVGLAYFFYYRAKKKEKNIDK
jgi:ATP-dependent Zn protease